MSVIGNKILVIRQMLKINREDASEKIGVTPEELKQIEINDADYYYPQMIRCSKLFNKSIYYMLDDNSDNSLIFRTPTRDEYFKFDETITCVTNLRNPVKRDITLIKRPECCNKPNARYYGWKVVGNEYCFSGVIVLEDVDEFAEDDIIVAIVKQKPVYGKFKAENGKFFIAPITNEKRRLSLTAKGSNVMGIVKHLDIQVN